MRYIASQGEGGIVSRNTLALAFLPAETQNFPSLQLLLQRELIEELGDGYRFQVEMIRQWFAAADAAPDG